MEEVARFLGLTILLSIGFLCILNIINEVRRR